MNNKVTSEHVNEIFNKANLTENILYDKCLVISVKLQNGFVIVESSACVDPKNFDINMGREICCNRIKDKIWELEGYKLQCELGECK